MTLTLRQTREIFLAIAAIDAGYPSPVKDDKGNERVANLPYKLPTKVRYALSRNHAFLKPAVVAFDKCIEELRKEFNALTQAERDARGDEWAARIEAEAQAMLDAPDRAEEFPKLFMIAEADYESELCAQPIPSRHLAALLPLVA